VSEHAVEWVIVDGHGRLAGDTRLAPEARAAWFRATSGTAGHLGRAAVVRSWRTYEIYRRENVIEYSKYIIMQVKDLS